MSVLENMAGRKDAVSILNSKFVEMCEIANLHVQNTIVLFGYDRI